MHIKRANPNTQKVPYYLQGDKFLSVMHARIRNNCSNLFNDLYKLVYKPCTCNDRNENVSHFFFNVLIMLTKGLFCYIKFLIFVLLTYILCYMELIILQMRKI